MRPQRKSGSIGREFLFTAVYLFVFALLLISSKPEWLMWAGPITLGAFPVSAPASLPPFDPAQAFRAAGSGAFLGMLALAALLFLDDGTAGTRPWKP